jgi:hypothetical protein
MTANQGRITRLGDTTIGLQDTLDKMHSGLIKTLWNTATGSRVVSSGTLTQSNGVFTLAHPTVFRSEGTKITLSTGTNHNKATLGNNTGSNDRYDLLYIDKSANTNLGQLSIAAGTFNTDSPQVADLEKDDVPIAIIKVPSGTSSLTGVTFDFQMLMSTFDKDVLNDNEVATAKIADDAVTYAKIQNVVNDERVLGRVSGANGVIEELTQAQVLTFLGGVEAGADVTDATNVNAAGAIMHTDIPDSDTGFVKRTGSETYDIDTSTYLTAEADTLDSVTGRGATTTNSISVGTITSTVNQNLGYEVHNNGTGPIMTGAKTVVYVDDITALTPANQVTLPPPAAGNILHIVNIGGVPITIIGNPIINLGLTTHAKIAVANQITLAPHEYVTLQAHNDTVAPLVTGHMIISD